MKKELQIKHKQVTGRVRILKAVLYRSHMIYIRLIGEDYFEYLTEYNGEIYSGYIIIKPREGKKKLSDIEIGQCRDLIYSGAEATIDMKLGVKVSEKDKKIIELFEKNRKVIEGKKNAKTI